MRKFQLYFFSFLIMLSMSFKMCLEATPPQKPTISVLQNWQEGGYDVQWNKWSGTDATKWSLFENGKLIFTAALSPSSNGVQSGTYSVRNPLYGVFSYQVVLANGVEETRSDVNNYAVDGASMIVSDDLDQNSQAIQVTLDLFNSQDITFHIIGYNSSDFKLSTNHKGIFNYQLISPNTIRLTGLKAGRGSLLIHDAITGYNRFVGIRVRDINGNYPGMPDYIAMGSVSEDTTEDLNFWKEFKSGYLNRWVDIRYIYINGGPKNQGVGWRTWTPRDGFRVTSYIRESIKLGMIPFLVFYNIPDGGESYYTNKQHLQNHSYMEGYFTDLKFALDLARQEAKDEMVGILLEPDSIGYLAQNNDKPDTLSAQTSAIYTSGVLTANDPFFPDTFKGTVEAINYTIRKYLPQAYFGWQINLWASPAGGFTIPIPGKGIVHLTDTLGIEKGRIAILKEASAIASYYISAGILSSDANFVSIDKYGLDAGAEGKWNDPASSIWFWNAIHWTNYLEFVKALSIKTQLPVILWQIPVGHINNSLAVNPYSEDGKFPPLTNTTRQFEDSAPTFFLGDQFVTNDQRLTFFSQDDAASSVSAYGYTVTWNSHMNLARKAGVTAILFGAGVGDSTDGVGSPPSDNYWWITKIQGYFTNPTPICSLTGDCPTDADLPSPDDDETPVDPNQGQITNFPSTLSYSQSKSSGWGSGALFEASIQNLGTTSISNLKIKLLASPNSIYPWNVTIIETNSTSVSIGLPSWKTSLAPGEVFSFGYVIQPEGEPNVTFVSMTQ